MLPDSCARFPTLQRVFISLSYYLYLRSLHLLFKKFFVGLSFPALASRALAMTSRGRGFNIRISAWKRLRIVQVNPGAPARDLVRFAFPCSVIFCAFICCIFIRFICCFFIRLRELGRRVGSHWLWFVCFCSSIVIYYCCPCFSLFLFSCFFFQVLVFPVIIINWCISFSFARSSVD